MAQVVFWVSVFLIAYHHVGYPVLLRVFAAAHRRKHPEATNSSDLAAPIALPSITIIVPAYNEAAVIAAKVRNLAELEYDRQRLSVILALDGCTDGTAAVASEAIAECSGSLDVRLHDYADNLGKTAVLNREIAAVTTDIVALTDASAAVNAGALLAAAARFQDARVGVVCGTYRLKEAAGTGERSYWKYQSSIKRDEAELAAPMGAHGAFYAFRRSLWSPLPGDTINDDFVLPMAIVGQGYRSVYETSIIASELDLGQPDQDFRRRVRIAAGNLQQALYLPSLADPRKGWLSFLFLSGKALRSVLPFAFVAAFVASGVLAAGGSTFFQLVLAAEVLLALVTLGSIGGWLALPRPLRSVTYLLQGHAAALVGVAMLLGRLQERAWAVSKAAKKGASGP